MVGFGVLYSAMRIMPDKTNFEVLVLFASEVTFMEAIGYIVLLPVLIIAVLYILYKTLLNK
jgi:hypothetical protein